MLLSLLPGACPEQPCVGCLCKQLGKEPAHLHEPRRPTPVLASQHLSAQDNTGCHCRQELVGFACLRLGLCFIPGPAGHRAYRCKAQTGIASIGLQLCRSEFACCCLCVLQTVRVRAPRSSHAQEGAVIPCILSGQSSATVLCLQADKKKTGRPIAFTGDPEDPALPAQVSSCNRCSRPGLCAP